MQCVNCGTETDNPKFCTQRCAAIYGNHTRAPIKWTPEKRARVAEAMRQKYATDPDYARRAAAALQARWGREPERFSHGEAHARAVGEAVRGKFKVPDSIMEVSTRTARKILRRLGIGCSRCGWNEDICDIHHIHGRKVPEADSHDNLTYLCPNHHRLAHAGKIPVRELVSLRDQIGERWREFYFG